MKPGSLVITIWNTIKLSKFDIGIGSSVKTGDMFVYLGDIINDVSLILDKDGLFVIETKCLKEL